MKVQKNKNVLYKSKNKQQKPHQPFKSQSFAEMLSNISSNSSSNFRILLAFLFFALAFLLYSNTLYHGYALDDDLVYKLNKSVQKGILGIPEIFTTTNMYGFNGQNYGAYRPLTQSIFAIEYHFFAQNPHVNHLISVLMYALCCALFFILMLKFFEKQKLIIPIFITLIFTVHPIHTEVVANIKSRDEIIAFFFGFLLTFLFLYKYVGSRKIKYLIFSIIFYFLGLLSKENILTLFPFIPLSLYFFREVKWKQIFRISALFLIPVLLFIGMRTAFIESASDKIAFIDNFIHLIPDFATKSGTILVVFLLYFKLSFFPFPLSYDYSFAQISHTSLFAPVSLCSLIILISLIVIAIYFFKRKSVLSWSILFFLITISIYLHIYADLAATAAERFLFLPSVAVSIAVIFLLIMIADKFLITKTANQFITVAVLTICMVFMIKTFTRNFAWKNNDSLFLTDITHAPKSVRMNKSAGDIYLNWAIKETDEVKKTQYSRTALTYLYKAYNIYADYPENILDIGTAYFYLEKYDSSQYYWNKFKLLDPKSPRNQENRTFLISGFSSEALKLREKGQIKESEAVFEKVLKLDSLNAPAFFNIGMLNVTLLNYPKAKANMQKAISIDSLNSEFWYNLGGFAYTIKDYNLARKAWLKTLQINPQHAQAKQGLSAIK